MSMSDVNFKETGRKVHKENLIFEIAGNAADPYTHIDEN